MAPTTQATAPDKQQLTEHCRAQLADLRALGHDLAPEEWDAPSLCAGWTVKDVFAHLLYGRLHGIGALVVGIARHGGSMDRWGDSVSRRLAQELSVADLLEQFDRETSRWPEGGIAGKESDTAKLADNVTHELDVRWAIGRRRELPADRMAAALACSTRTNMWGNRGRLKGLSFQATDAPFASGAGPLVSGPAQDLLLALNGRSAGAAGLQGDGVAELERRLAA